MNPAAYTKKIFTAVKRIAANTGRSPFAVFLSFLHSFIVCHTGIEEFEIIPLYEYSTYVQARQYLTYRRAKKTDRLLSRQATQEDYDRFNTKNLFNRDYAEFVHRDWIYAPDSTEEELLAFFDRNDRFLAKAVVSTCGENIYLYQRGAFDPRAVIEEYRDRPFLLEAFIQQHPAMSAINPTSVNTVRIVTARIGDKIGLMGGCLRCGGAGAYVDNFHHGGVAFNLDLESGVVTGRGKSLDGGRFLRHPATGYLVTGFQVPHWDLVLETVRRAALLTPRLGYLGWDIAVTEEGVELIEGNADLPDNTLMQIDKPDAYARIRAFIREAGGAV